MKPLKSLPTAKLEIAYIRTWMISTALIIYFFYAAILIVLRFAYDAGTTAPVVAIAILMSLVSILMLVVVGVGGYMSVLQVSDVFAKLEEGLVGLREGQYGRRIELSGDGVHSELECAFNETSEFLRSRYG
ncbi:MAG: hypothetical protein KC800_03075 [Candidatus Eremiobacteraeota bacterium]|nr:hypothetical protein [Candidatus Eremiobacteraeota bacterium]